MTERGTPRHRNQERGFTLVELMVAIVVIAVGLLALARVQTQSSRDVYATGRDERALGLAQQRIEIARGSGYASVAADSGQSGVFAWVTRVDSVDVELKQVRVSVSWREPTRTRNVQLSTLVSAR
jgi:type IV pilus assembly protein PilV